MTIPPFRLLQADYPSTILGLQYDSVDAFDGCEYADTLLQIGGHPLTILRTSFDNSAEPFEDSVDTPLTIPQISSPMPRKNCGLPTR